MDVPSIKLVKILWLKKWKPNKKYNSFDFTQIKKQFKQIGMTPKQPINTKVSQIHRFEIGLKCRQKTN